MEPTLGYVTLFAGNFAPRSWALCQGQILPINQNQALYSLLGINYGGDGRTTFGLPELRGRCIVGAAGASGLGTRGGAQGVSLTTAQLPAHGHTVTGTPSLPADANAASAAAPDGGRVPARGFLAGLGRDLNLYRAPTATTALGGPFATVASTGGGQAHPNEQPYQAIHYIIALQGLFPSRN
jgi:microcystin-dependent protein